MDAGVDGRKREGRDKGGVKKKRKKGKKWKEERE